MSHLNSTSELLIAQQNNSRLRTNLRPKTLKKLTEASSARAIPAIHRIPSTKVGVPSAIRLQMQGERALGQLVLVDSAI